MSEQRTVEVGDTLSHEESRADKKARLAQVLDRGFVGTRLEVTNLPENVKGQWFHNDPVEILRAESLGFEVDTQYAPSKHDLHGAKDGKAVVGDLIFMITSSENMELLDEIAKERYEINHGLKQVEDNVGAETDLPTDVSGKVEEVGATEIQAAIERS